MASDMVVALGSSTVGGATVFGVNQHGAGRAKPVLRRVAGRHCSPDETLKLGALSLPQTRQTCTVLGSQAPGAWGFGHGCNEHHVVVGCAGWQSRLERDGPGLLGPDLVRLALERSHSARHAVDVLTELIGRHGQGSQTPQDEDGTTDHLFLIADGSEALLLEAAGRFWALQECQEARAAADVALIRQDWRGLAPGLADHAIKQAWWPDDGSKLDFAGRLAAQRSAQPFALKRWGQATLLLEQQNGHLDVEGARRLLIEHFEDTIVKDRPNASQPAARLEASFVVPLSSDPSQVGVAWVGLGPNGNEIYFPVLLEGELPPLLERPVQTGLLARHPAWMPANESKHCRAELDRLQLRLDQETEACIIDLTSLKRQGNTDIVARQATAFMQAQAELLDGPTPDTAPTRQWSKQADVAFVTE